MRWCSKWSSPLRGSVFVAALSLALPARAQSADAGASPPAETEPSAAPSVNEAQADPGAGAGAAAGSAAEPAEPAPPPGLKTLTPSQRLPENLQGWMRERQRRNPALVERRPIAETQPAFVPRVANDDPDVDVLKRRLRSFSEGGVTVLSNRHEATGPIAPQVTRVAAAAAVPQPAPAPAPVAEPGEADLDDSAAVAPSVETRALRAQPSSARRAKDDSTPAWPAWLAVCAAIGLVVVWLRKRRAEA